MASVHCEWGEQGLAHLRETTDVFVIVDVFSFSTATDVAVSRGARVYPYAGMDLSPEEFAAQIGGVAAGPMNRPGLSLSPSSLLTIPAGTRLVLPSRNGSRLSVLTGEIPTLAGCLRNARAVAEAAQALGERISVIAGGERWPDGSLRAAVEDWLGAGAVIANLRAQRSVEAELAARSFEAARDNLEATLRGSTSGQELARGGRLEDVRIAADLNGSQAAPRKVNGAYQA